MGPHCCRISPLPDLLQRRKWRCIVPQLPTSVLQLRVAVLCTCECCSEVRGTLLQLYGKQPVEKGNPGAVGSAVSGGCGRAARAPRYPTPARPSGVWQELAGVWRTLSKKSF
eukprot:gene8605-biopygen109